MKVERLAITQSQPKKLGFKFAAHRQLGGIALFGTHCRSVGNPDKRAIQPSNKGSRRDMHDHTKQVDRVMFIQPVRIGVWPNCKEIRTLNKCKCEGSKCGHRRDQRRQILPRPIQRPKSGHQYQMVAVCRCGERTNQACCHDQRKGKRRMESVCRRKPEGPYDQPTQKRKNNLPLL